MRKKPKTSCSGGLIYLLVFLLLLPIAVGAQVEAPPATWKAVEKDIARTLGKINESMDSLFFNIEVRQGSATLGSGTLAFQRGGDESLDMYSAFSSCHFLRQSGSSTCFIQNRESTIAFRSDQSAQVPVPLIRIEKVDAENFNLDLRVNIGNTTASQSMNLFVHPDTPGYMTMRMRQKFPDCVIGSGTYKFYQKGKKKPGVELNYHDGKISSISVFFPQKEGLPVQLSVNSIIVNGPIPALKHSWLSAEARTVGSSKIDSMGSFIKGFYQLLGEWMPK